MGYKNRILYVVVLVVFISSSYLSGYTHEQFKQDSSKLLDSEIQNKYGSRKNEYTDEDITKQLKTMSSTDFTHIIDENNSIVHNFMQATFANADFSDSYDVLLTLLEEVVKDESMVYRMKQPAIEIEKLILNNAQQSAISKYIYAHEAALTAFDADVIAILESGIALLSQSEKDLLKGYILSKEEDLFFGYWEIVALGYYDAQGNLVEIPTYALYNSQRRAHVISDASDHQLAYLAFMVWLGHSSFFVTKILNENYRCF